MVIEKWLIIFFYNLIFCLSLQNFFITNSEQCPQNMICDGSFNNPFAGLISAFSQSIISSHLSQDFSIIFHLISNNYTITDQDLVLLSGNQYIQLYNRTYQLFEKTIDSGSKTFFDNIKMKPYLCSNDSTIECSNKIIINLKTENFSITISGTMNIENINWYGNNLPFKQLYTDYLCINSSNNDCCNILDLFDNSSINCSLINYDNSNRKALTKYDYYHGLFLFKYSNSALNIIRCSFNYIISISENSYEGFLFLIGSYVNLQKKYNPNTNKGGLFVDKINVTLINSSFESNYFINGLIYLYDNSNNNTIITFSHTNISNYNTFKIADISQNYNNFTIVISNSTLKLEFACFYNTSNPIYAYLQNQLFFTSCTYNLVFSQQYYDKICIFNAFMYNNIEISDISVNIPFIDSKYVSNIIFNFSPLEDQGRLYYCPSNYQLFVFSYNSTFSLENSFFIDINHVGLIQAINFTTITLQNLATLNNFSLLSFSANLNTKSCLFYGNNENNIFILNSSFIGFYAVNYSPFMFLYSKNLVTMNGIYMNNIVGLGLSSGFYVGEENTIYIDNTTFSNIIGCEGTILYLSDYNNVYMTNVININVSSNSTDVNAIYLGRDYGNNLYFDNCSFYNMNGIIVETVFIGIVVLNNIYVKNDGITNTLVQVLVVYINSTGYLNNSIIEGCYSQNALGLVYSFSNFSYVYLYNDTFRDNYMFRGTILLIDTQSFGEIFNCTFINSTSLDFGGSIYIEKQSNLKIIQCNFISSHSLISGGTIFSSFSNEILLIESNFSFSNARWYGGFIEIEENNSLSIISCQFDTLSIMSKGGFIYAKTDNTIMLFNIFLNNCISNLGSIIYLVNFNTANIININVTNVLAGRSGGIIFSYLNNTIIMYNCNYSFVNSLNLAGGMYLDSSNIINISNCFLLNISSENSGGILYSVLENSIIFNNSKIINSFLSYGDGAILFDLINSNILVIINSEWVNISSFYTSYAISLENENQIVIFNNTFQSQVTIYFEGFILANKDNIINITFTNISYNKDSIQSGIFIQLLKNSSIIEASYLNITINNNIIIFYIFGGSSVSLNYVNFNNISTNYYIMKLFASSQINITNIKWSFSNVESIMGSDSYFYISNCIFLFKSLINRANNPFFYIDSSNLTIKSSKMKGNFQEMQFISATNSEIFLRKSDFIGFFTSQSGSVLYGETLNIIEISKCLFLFNQAQNSGGVISITLNDQSNLLNSFGNITIIFTHNIFANNIAFSYGGSVSLKNLESNLVNLPNLSLYSLLISNSTFYFNKAVDGGALYLADFFSTEIRFNMFKYNVAVEGNLNSSIRSKGGAIYGSYSQILNPLFINNNNLFRINQAGIGGALYFDNFLFIYTEEETNTVIFQDNEAIHYGQDKATSISSIGFLQSYNEEYTQLSDIQQNLSVSNIASGQINNCLFYIVGVDKFQNIAYNNDETIPFKFNLLTESSSSLDNQLKYNISEGFICFLSFQRNQFPIKSFFSYYLNLSQTLIPSQSYLNISFRECQLGEKQTKDYTCDICPVNKYSLVIDFKNDTNDCFQCKNYDFNCLGGSNLTPTSGYWRYSNYSVTFLQCPQPKHCLGGIITLENMDQKKNDYSRIFTTINNVGDVAYSLIGFCSLGYSGVLCNECDEGYGKVNAFTCLQCYGGGYSSWIVIQIVIKFAFIFISLHISLITSISIFMGDVKEKNIKMTFLIKIFLNHVQILIILFAFIDIKDPFNDVIGFSLGFSSNISEAFNLECLLKYYQWNTSATYFQFWISIIYWFPLGLFIFLYCYILFVKKIKQYKLFACVERFKFINLFAAAFLILLDLCYFDMIDISFKLFNCVNVNDDNNPERRLLFDYSVQCDTSYHHFLQYFSLFIVILCFGLGFPLALFCYLYYSYTHRQLNNDSCLLKVSYFYFVYQRKYFFWDILHILRKLIALIIQILLASDVMITNNISLQILLILVLFFLFLQIRLRPYDREKYDVINRLEQYSLISLTLSIYLLLLYKSLIADAELLDVGIEAFFFCLALLANLVFAILWFYIYIPEKKKELTKIITDLKKKLPTSINALSKKEITSFESIPKIELNMLSKQELFDHNDVEMKTRVDFGSGANLLSQRGEFIGIKQDSQRDLSFKTHIEINSKNDFLKNENCNNNTNVGKTNVRKFNEKDFSNLIKINEKYFLKSIIKKNMQNFKEKSLQNSLDVLSIDEYFNHNIQNVKFVRNLFQDQIHCLYECPEMIIGIEFFETKGSTMIKKCKISFKKRFNQVKFGFLKFKSHDSIFLRIH